MGGLAAWERALAWRCAATTGAGAWEPFVPERSRVRPPRPGLLRHVDGEGEQLHGTLLADDGARAPGRAQ
jgi:hypothetical protein